MNNNNKVVGLVLGVIAGLFGLSLLFRFVLLSQYGVPPIFYFGLPIGGIGLILLLLRLGLFNSDGTSGRAIHHWQQPSGVQPQPAFPPLPPASPPLPPAFSPPAPAFSPPAVSVSQRLQELETLRATGVISDAEYTAKRQQIISTM